ncbi:MAG: hypothetical protein U0800_06205 [Isosphaeraceae bacterium]
MMLWIACFALASTPDGPAAPDENLFPLTLHRTMELDDHLREIRRQHDQVIARRAQFQNTRSLFDRKLVSREQFERERADLKFQEAREAEMVAYKDLKVYERNALDGSIPAEPLAGSKLLLTLLSKQEAMARVEMEYRGFRLQQEQALYERKATSRQQRDLALIDFETARGNVEISVARQAQVAMELAARSGQLPEAKQLYEKHRDDYFQARIRYGEIRVAGLKKRLEFARQSRDAGLSNPTEVEMLEQMLRDAQEDLEADRKLKDDRKSPLPPSSTRFT